MLYGEKFTQESKLSKSHTFWFPKVSVGNGELFAAISLSCGISCLQMYDTTPLLKGVGEGITDTLLGWTWSLFCFPLPPGQNCLLLSVMLSQLLYFFSKARNSGIYTKFTIPRKQLTKVQVSSMAPKMPLSLRVMNRIEWRHNSSYLLAQAVYMAPPLPGV